VFESNRDGKRLESRTLSFGNDVPGTVSYSLAIDRAQTFQEIIGFGGSWSDAAAIGLGRMSIPLRTQILKAYFSEEGIEYSTARVVISGSDFSTRPYSYDDTVDDWGLNNWVLADEDVQYKVTYLTNYYTVNYIVNYQLTFLDSSNSRSAKTFLPSH
jgi:glucosylceramidase